MQLNQFTKILSDETRLRILMLLMKDDELCVCQLTEVLKLSQPKISRHLAIMREADLLQDRKSGLWVYYRLNNKLPTWINENLNTLLVVAHNQPPYNDDFKLLSSSKVKELANCK